MFYRNINDTNTLCLTGQSTEKKTLLLLQTYHKHLFIFSSDLIASLIIKPSSLTPLNIS